MPRKKQLLIFHLKLVKNKKSFIQSYAKMLKIIKKTGSDVKFSSASPNSATAKSIKISGKRISHLYDVISSNTDAKKSKKIINGKLVAFDTKTRKFKIEYSKDGSPCLLSGNVADEVITSGESYVILDEYDATLEVTRTLNKSNSEMEESFKLIKMVHSGS